MGVLSPGLGNVMIAVGVAAVPTYARLARASVLSARELLYVEAARAMGGRDHFILTRYILPNVVAPLIVTSTLGGGGACGAGATEMLPPVGGAYGAYCGAGGAYAGA